MAGTLGSSALVVVSIDNANVTNATTVFSYLNNPNVTSVFPRNTIPAGGITLTFTGVGMDVVQQPRLRITSPPGVEMVHTHTHTTVLLYHCTTVLLYYCRWTALWWTTRQ